MTNVRLAKQVTVHNKAHIQLYLSEGFVQHLDYKNVYEGEANSIHISIYIFMNCVVFVLKAK